MIGTIPPWGPERSRKRPIPVRKDSSASINSINGSSQFAAAQGIQMVDYHSLLVAANGENYIPALTVDGVHPSAAGYAVMTPYTEQALQAALPPPSAFPGTTLRPLKQFRNWCRPKPRRLSWFSPQENHSSRPLWDHSHCETALK